MNLNLCFKNGDMRMMDLKELKTINYIKGVGLKIFRFTNKITGVQTDCLETAKHWVEDGIPTEIEIFCNRSTLDKLEFTLASGKKYFTRDLFHDLAQIYNDIRYEVGRYRNGVIDIYEIETGKGEDTDVHN